MNDPRDPEDFRAAAERAVTWATDFLAHPDRWPVLPSVEPGEVSAALPAAAPELGESMDVVLDDFERIIAPANTQWNHPGFFAYFGISSPGPAIVAELLAATLNPNAMVWMSSPAATELEFRMMEWLRDLVGLPETFFGTITDTASTSSMYALAAARHSRLPEATEQGLAGGPVPRIYTSDQTHSSVEKAGIALGFGRAGVRAIPTDERFQMRPAALASAVAEDRAAGHMPLAVVATIGTTSSTSVDPVSAIADIAAREDLWLHVDAAYGGCAAIVPELRGLFEGWDRADSVVINPHKWLFVPVDCSALYVRDAEGFRDTFSVLPEYLRTPMDGATHNLMEFGLALGRRFRSLKLWFSMRAFGAEGMRALIRGHLKLARLFAEWVDESPRWERVAPVPFSLVAFGYIGVDGEDEQDAATRRILERVNASGEVFLSHTVLAGRVCLRMAIGNFRTREAHVRRAWDLLEAAADEEVAGHRA